MSKYEEVKYEGVHKEINYRSMLLATCLKLPIFKVQSDIMMNNHAKKAIMRAKIEDLIDLTTKVCQNPEKNYEDEISEKFLGVSKKKLNDFVGQIMF